jgi:NAD dependent epimerase/dehydratase
MEQMRGLAGKRVLVTGADGFIGSHLCETLVQNCGSLRALIQYNSLGSWGWLDGSAIQNEIEGVLGDLRDSAQMLELCKDVDLIFHLGALIAIPYSYHAPGSYVATNMNGTLNILQGALTHEVEKLVQVSTSEVYGSAKQVPMDETHPLNAQSPYSASKIGADALAYSFYCSFDLPVVIARPFNTYGPRQSSRAVIPTIITQLLEGKDCLEMGNLSPTRDFNYVLDTCGAMIALCESKSAVGEVVNIGSGREISIGALVEKLKQLTGQKISKVTVDSVRVRKDGSEVDRLLCDATKLRNLTGYKYQVSLSDGLSKTLDWFKDKNNRARYRAGYQI